MRDEFPKSVIEMLGKRVGLRCSNPSCRKLTSGPHSDQAKALNVGVAGHITAASFTGPRYDPSLTPEQRCSIENGIWLCQTCGKLVDNDAARYPVSLLQDWRRQAEEAALNCVEAMTQSGMDHSIRFAVDEWQMWRERGNLPDDPVVVISGWRRGDLRYSCTIRLRNNLDWEDQLHEMRIEFRKGNTILDSDEYAFTTKPLELPPKKWVSVDVCHGLYDGAAYDAADSVWFTAKTVGDNIGCEWPLTTLIAPVEELDFA